MKLKQWMNSKEIDFYFIRCKFSIVLNNSNFLSTITMKYFFSAILLFFGLLFPANGETGFIFEVGRLQLKGIEADSRPQGFPSLLKKMVSMCNINTETRIRLLKLDKAELFKYPFIYLNGTGDFPKLQDSDLYLLRNYLLMGGFLFIDDQSCDSNSPFMNSVRKFLKELFPDKEIERLGENHSVYKSFYLLDRAVGRCIERSFLEGINVGDRTAVIISSNDLLGSWQSENGGKFSFTVFPGGEYQRTLAIRLGINIIYYALTLDYKNDQVHIPEILKRRKMKKLGDFR